MYHTSRSPFNFAASAKAASSGNAASGDVGDLDVFMGQQVVVERLQKAIRAFVSREVHSHVHVFKERIRSMKGSLRVQKLYYEEKILNLSNEHKTILKEKQVLANINDHLTSQVHSLKQTLQEQTESFLKERQWWAQQLSAYAFSLANYQKNAASPTPNSDIHLSVSSPAASSPLAPTASTSTSTSDIPSLVAAHSSRSSMQERNISASPTTAATSTVPCVPPSLPPPPPPKLPGQSVLAPDRKTILRKLKESKDTMEPKLPKAVATTNTPDIVSHIRNFRPNLELRTQALAHLEQKKKQAAESKKIENLEIAAKRTSLKNTGGIKKIEEHRTKQEEIVRQKVLEGRPASHATTYTYERSSSKQTANRPHSRSNVTNHNEDDDTDDDSEDDLDSPINMMVQSFLSQTPKEEDGLGSLVKNLLRTSGNKGIS